MTPIRRFAAPALAIGLIALAGCGAGTSGIPSLAIDLDIDRQTVDGFAEPALSNCDFVTNAVLGPGSIAPFSFNLRESRELQGQTIIEFKRVVLEAIDLQIVDEASGGDADNFDFIDSIRLFADDDPSDDRPAVLVAELDPVPRGQKMITIPGTGVDISDIASAETFQVSADVNGRPPCDDVNFVGEAKFAVTLF